MAKEPASTSLEEDLLKDIKRVAEIERKSIAEILALCIELGFEHLEEDSARRAKELAEVFEKGQNLAPMPALPPKPESIQSYPRHKRRKK